MKNNIKVFRLDDIEWWAGESLEACIAAGRAMCGDECYPDDDSIQGEVTDEAMQRLIFVDDDGNERTFAEELRLNIEAGMTFPSPFAATEW